MVYDQVMIQVMKSRAYQEGIKCSLYEAMFVQPMKVGLKTSNLPDDAIEDIFTKEEIEKIFLVKMQMNRMILRKILPSRKMIYQILLMLKGQYWNSRKKHVKKMCHPQKW